MYVLVPLLWYYHDKTKFTPPSHTSLSPVTTQGDQPRDGMVGWNRVRGTGTYDFVLSKFWDVVPKGDSYNNSKKVLI